MSVFSKFLYLSSASLCMMGLVSPAVANEDLRSALTDGTFSVDARYRYEFVDQEGLPEKAHASTLRTRAGYKTGEFYGVSAMVEGENIQQIGPDNYNDTLNGRTDHPVVSDVEDTLINQLYLNYSGLPDTNVRVGRQVMKLDNQRFVGQAAWRQNDMTFDVVKAENTSLPNTKLTYGYIWKATRARGTRTFVGQVDVDAHAIHAANTSTPLGTIALYGYLFDTKDGVSPVFSNKTFGGSLVGEQSLNDKTALTYRLEYARQSDYGSNTVDYAADYYHLSPGVKWGGFFAKAGYEVRGSDDGVATVQGLLGARHGPYGWADVFLTTPTNGLQDSYVGVGYTHSKEGIFDGLSIKGQYHTYRADNGSSEYGEEYGVFVKQPIAKNYYVSAQYADYRADNFSTDRQRLMFDVGMTF